MDEVMTSYQGCIQSVFSVSDSKKVFFSKGNLQYIGSAATPYWKFADNQYDYLGTTTGQNSTDTDKDRDLFGWGTSGSAPSGQTARAPYYTTQTNTDYVSNITTDGANWGTGSEWDWGHNAISNGGNTADVWRTLTKGEWLYLINSRTNAANKVGYATVGGKNGIIILPDEFNDPMKNNGSGAFVPKATTGWSANVYTANWEAMEAAGAVFLPASGRRDGTSMISVGSFGCYWSSTVRNANQANYLDFASSYMDPVGYNNKYHGNSVRLVVVVE